MSKFLVITTIDDFDLLEDVLKAWTRIGVRGATVIESSGMGRLVAGGIRDDFPLMPHLSNFLNVRNETSRTIFSVVAEEATVEAMAAEAERIVGSFNQPNTGIMFVVPVLKAYGLDR